MTHFSCLSESEKTESMTHDVRVFNDGRMPDMAVIPSGFFQMGCNEHGFSAKEFEPVPVHEVVIKSFALGVTPVTFDQYDYFVTETDRQLPDDKGWGRKDRPVINVTWDDAMAYTTWLSEKTGRSYRLPSESEWEYACRATTTTTFFWEDEDLYPECTSFYRVFATANDVRTAPVKSCMPSVFGLYDMAGNVWEWCADYWHVNYEGAPRDGSAWMEADNGDPSRRVLRGGSWRNGDYYLASARRNRDDSDTRRYNYGFRVAASL